MHYLVAISLILFLSMVNFFSITLQLSLVHPLLKTFIFNQTIKCSFYWFIRHKDTTDVGNAEKKITNYNHFKCLTQQISNTTFGRAS